ncbi:MAG: ATP-binding cassette domain-containing protein [Oscillospiraceae bacterium]
MKIRAFSKTFGRWTLVFPSFELAGGSICAVIGANGSGKSTLARVLAGVLLADGKKEVFDIRPNIGYMPQKSYAFRMSTEKNLRLAGADRAEARRMLETLQIGHLSASRAKLLSGGETARMALGRVLVCPHELLILDEPTASMDVEATLLTEKLIRDYCREQSAAVLWVTHSLAQARRVADTALFLHKGQLWESGSADKLLRAPERDETRSFLAFFGE